VILDNERAPLQHAAYSNNREAVSRSAQCCREAATLGTRHYRFRNPDRVASLLELVSGVAFRNAGLEAVTASRSETRRSLSS